MCFLSFFFSSLRALIHVGGPSYIIRSEVYKSSGNHSCGNQNNSRLAAADVMKYSVVRIVLPWCKVCPEQVASSERDILDCETLRSLMEDVSFYYLCRGLGGRALFTWTHIYRIVSVWRLTGAMPAPGRIKHSTGCKGNSLIKVQL